MTDVPQVGEVVLCDSRDPLFPSRAVKMRPGVLLAVDHATRVATVAAVTTREVLVSKEGRERRRRPVSGPLRELLHEPSWWYGAVTSVPFDRCADHLGWGDDEVTIGQLVELGLVDQVMVDGMRAGRARRDRPVAELDVSWLETGWRLPPR